MSATAEDQLPKELKDDASIRNASRHSSDDMEKGVPSPDSHSEEHKIGDARRTVHGWRWVLVCVSIYVAAFTYGLDTTIAADVQGAVVETFGQVDQLSWLGTGFLLGSVATILPIGNAFERFDQKWCFVAGLVLFEIGSAICGAAPAMNALIVGRVLAGIGGSGVYVGGLSIFTTLTTETERGAYIAGMGVCWGVGAVVGPLIGGGFSVSSATWRWGFYINLVIAAVCAPIYLFCLPSVKPSAGQGSIAHRLASIDWIGALLSAAIWVLFCLIFTFGGASWAWSDGRTIASFVVFGVLLVGFLVQQKWALLTSKANRIFPAHLLKSRTQVLLFVGTAAVSSGTFLPIYYIPVFFQFTHGDSPINAAVRLLPFLVIAMTTNFVCGALVPKLPRYAVLYVASGVFMLAGAAPLYTITPTTPISQIYGFTVLIALGAGATLQSGYTLAAVKLVTQNRFGDVQHAIAFQNVAQIGSGAIGLTVGGQLFQSFAFKHLSAVLEGRGFADAEIRAAVAGTQSALFSQIDAATAARATEAITSAMSNVWIMVIVSGAVSIVAGAAMRWERLF